MDVRDQVCGQAHRLRIASQALVAVAEAENVTHAVVLRQPQHQAADHVVQARAQSPARHDADPGAGRVKVDVLPRPARLQRGQFAHRAPARGGHTGRIVEQDPIGFVHVVLRAGPAAQQLGQRRYDRRRAQPVHNQVGGADRELITSTHHAQSIARSGFRHVDRPPAAAISWPGAGWLARDQERPAVTGRPSAVTVPGPRPSRGDPSVVPSRRFSDRKRVALGVAEGEHGGHAGPAEDLVEVDAGG